MTRHAGWQGFWGDCSLLGPRNAKNDRQWARTLRDARGMDGYLDDDDGLDDPDFIRNAQIIPICFHENYGMLGFDRRTPAVESLGGPPPSMPVREKQKRG